MAAKLHHPDAEIEEQHEINVTPFIDVMLVLLIIFMIAAPLATVNVPLDLPVSAAQPAEPPQDPIVLSVQSDLSLSLGDTPLSKNDLTASLGRATHGDTQARIYLRADKKVPYGDLMEVMDSLRKAGYTKVALVTLEAGR